MTTSSTRTDSLDDAALLQLMKQRREGWSLPREFYSDAAVFNRDVEEVWMKSWLYAGHSSQIANAGDFFLFDVGEESVVLIRADDGQIHALANVCTHRGSRICLEASGQARKLVCPYHQWVFDKDGTLLGAKGMQADFDKSQFGLQKIQIRVLEGLIFVCFAEDAPDFDVFQSAYLAHLQPYQLTKTKIAHTSRYVVESNWKLVVENSRECYHCSVGHPDYCRVIIGSNVLRSSTRFEQVANEKRDLWKAQGVETECVDFAFEKGHYCARYPYEPGFETQSLDGLPIAPLLGNLTTRDVGVFSIVQYPNVWIDINNDHMWTMRLTPLNALQCEIELAWHVRDDAQEGADYNVEHLTGFWRTTGEQDWKLCSDNQAGVNSRFYQPGIYSPSEGGLDQFNGWYFKQLRESIAGSE